ncbi:Transcription factor vrtR1 [Fulvia fulva]|uniref:Transcription factor vrtR1 n=1 Tax=Passalora fulva TaxID=5499 RepID=A0A9Q8P9L7_PASFU|nr:Transcription factor vrtR1 [Fulvia fulva]KAK4624663.1 Transcription factor vrtR1 [Fulvia fulva]KAK4625104.1 Transcription factor vrtR1 [Fulvia fulva]UJO18076.1 Transcription factor vrtR1 [Fulvia fulva]WPV15543.1 Transcription factor vrtR1 [Fulvia fulva]WPV30531.1 Transcription factor vrtR1 [Fulvia fulva]
MAPMKARQQAKCHIPAKLAPKGMLWRPQMSTKVKCDKAIPTCFTCRRSKVDCVYQAPPPRRRKRKLIDDVTNRLEHYENLLLEHGILRKDAITTTTSTPGDETSLSATKKSPILNAELVAPYTADMLEEAGSNAPGRSVGKNALNEQSMTLHWNEGSESATTNRLIAGQGKSRYIGSHLWRNLNEEEMQPIDEEDDEEEEERQRQYATYSTQDPLTGALMGGANQSLLQYHPTHTEAMALWRTHVENVEPLCRILHVPSVSTMVKNVSQQPVSASKSEECLLFAIYHFAVVSMTEAECEQRIGHSREVLKQDYRFAIRQALVNASWLKTTEMVVLQALVLFLMACRYSYDPHTYWILTGVAVRISQRMGLHHDGDALGMSPFEVQMRRRLFYQVIPLDGVASQLSGTGVGILADSWDTKAPWNINDDQIWPGMTEQPVEQKGATDMIFCLTRACIGVAVAKSGKTLYGISNDSEEKNISQMEILINKIEADVEEKYIRYCDIINPLHFLAVGLGRSAMVAMRLRIRLHKIRSQTANDAERKEAFQLSQKILDTDTAAHAHSGLAKFKWHTGAFFAWGSWDAFIYFLTCLSKPGLLTQSEHDGAWAKMEQVYHNHDDLLKSGQALHVAAGRLAVKAWDASPPSDSVGEPAFIATLRARREESLRKSKARAPAMNVADAQGKVKQPGVPTADAFGGVPAFQEDTFSPDDVSLDTLDWIYWDQLIQDYQANGGG